MSWWEGHHDSYDVNYHGSSPALEATGALRIWQRSVQKHNLRYMVIISDSDTKTMKYLNEHKPYGDLEIVKHECVGHVQKRLGTQLRTLNTPSSVVFFSSAALFVLLLAFLLRMEVSSWLISAFNTRFLSRILRNRAAAAVQVASSWFRRGSIAVIP